MNTQFKFQLIKEAQNYLVNNPKDYAHEITHHFRTWANAQKIVEAEKLTVNMDILEVICWWHDVILANNQKYDHKSVTNVALYLSQKFEGEENNIVLDSIENHEFGLKPKYIEGKILQDADKLEILSEERLKIMVEAIKAGLHSKEQALQALPKIKSQWFPIMPRLYNFEYSKKVHASLVDNINKKYDFYIESIKNIEV